MSKKKSVTSRTAEIAKPEDFLQLPDIQKLVHQITRASTNTGEGYIQAAQRLVRLRIAVERHEEALGMNWLQFARKYLRIEKNRRGVLLRLMEAKTRREQDAIVRRYLDNVNARAEKSRTKKQNERASERNRERRMPQWKKDFLNRVRKAPIEEAQRAWAHVNVTFAKLT